MPPFADAYRPLEAPDVAPQHLSASVQDDIDTIASTRAMLELLASELRRRRTVQMSYGRGDHGGLRIHADAPLDRVDLPELCGNWCRAPEDIDELIRGLDEDEAALRLRGPALRGEDA